MRDQSADLTVYIAMVNRKQDSNDQDRLRFPRKSWKSIKIAKQPQPNQIVRLFLQPYSDTFLSLLQSFFF